MPRSEEPVRTIRAQWLGQQMRELRERRGLTLRDAGEYIGRDLSAVGRYELAEWPFRRGDVMALLDLYNVFDGQERSRLIQLADEAWRTDEWDADFTDATKDKAYVNYDWLESRARLIGIYGPTLIHVLFQTRPYAEAMIRLTDGERVPAPKLARRLELRLARQRILDSGNARVTAVLDDSVLRRRVGVGAELMRDQLTHLAELAKRPNVELLVLPTEANVAARIGGQFVVFKMPDPYPEVAYTESLAGRFYLEAPKSKRFINAYDELRRAALSADESTAFITRLADELP